MIPGKSISAKVMEHLLEKEDVLGIAKDLEATSKAAFIESNEIKAQEVYSCF
jgi:vacuolar-type H+-ATPase subunit C/Vma6